MIFKVISLFITFFYISTVQSEAIKMPDDIQLYKDIRFVMPHDMFETVKIISENILSNCSPPECIVIGLGRSPTPIMAYLDAKFPGSAVELPLSAFRYITHGNTANDPPMGLLTVSEEKRLFNYFDLMLKKHITRKVKKIQLIDYAIKGISLYTAQMYLNEYLKKYTHQIELGTSAITEAKLAKQVREIADNYNLKRPKVYGLNKNSTASAAFMSEWFDAVSTYQRYDFLRYEELKSPELNEDERVKAFREYMKERVNNPTETLKKDCIITQSILLMGL